MSKDVHRLSIHAGLRGARSRLALGLASLLCLLTLEFIPAMRAQSDDRPPRKVLQSSNPEYPALLKYLGIGGIVRLNARVLANGTVAQVSIRGSNPVLAESAAKAVMTWKYAPAAAASNEVVILDFKSH